MYSSILWKTDGSRHADAALAEALALLEAGGEIIAFHCDQRFVVSHIDGDSVLLDELDRPARRVALCHPDAAPI